MAMPEQADVQPLITPRVPWLFPGRTAILISRRRRIKIERDRGPFRKRWMLKAAGFIEKRAGKGSHLLFVNLGV